MYTETLHFPDFTSSRNISTFQVGTNNATFFVPRINIRSPRSQVYLRPQLLQMSPSMVRRQQVVVVLLQEKQLRPNMDARISIEIVVIDGAVPGHFRVERTGSNAAREWHGEGGERGHDAKPLSEPSVLLS